MRKEEFSAEANSKLFRACADKGIWVRMNQRKINASGTRTGNAEDYLRLHSETEFGG
jgi:hypothetical protein